MIQGTTPTHEYTLPVAADQIAKLRLTYSQSGRTVLTKTEADMERSGYTWAVKLTQNETFKFKPGEAEAEIRGLCTDGNVVQNDPKKPIKFTVYEAQNKEVLK